MCGRYTLTAFQEQLAEEFELVEADLLRPRFNVAPTQFVPVVRLLDEKDRRQLDELRWGLIPHWAKDSSIGSRMINARSEEASSKPAFRVPLRRQRCLVPCTGFFEWKELDETMTRGRKKQPFYIRRHDDRPMAFAGLWDRWERGDGKTIESFAILTTAPNGLIRPMHNRMPVIIRRADYELWLDPKIQDTERFKSLFAPFPDDELTAYPFSTQVNNTKFDDPACIKAAV